MADTTLTPSQLNPDEQQILDRLLATRADLILLKQDRTTYVKSCDVISLYNNVIEQVNLLNEIRRVHVKENKGISDTFNNCHLLRLTVRNYLVDQVLEECFQLISLFFMTIGRNNEGPAAYALTSTILRLLDHLTESELYCAKDLAHVSQTLVNLSETVKGSEAKHCPHLITLLSSRLEACKEACLNLQRQLQRLDPGVAETHEKLISILRSISLANTKGKVIGYHRTVCKYLLIWGPLVLEFRS
jgi:hypothetical protein